MDLKYKGYVSNFSQENKLYVVIFDLIVHFETAEREKFTRAAEKGFCSRYYGCTGIKATGNGYELKISTGAKLIGRGV